jgi:hypothetical protein
MQQGKVEVLIFSFASQRQLKDADVAGQPVCFIFQGHDVEKHLMLSGCPS